MSPPKRSQGSGQKKVGQALISRFFFSQATPSSSKSQPASATTKPRSAVAETPVKPAASPAKTPVPTGTTPVAQRASDGVGKRVLPNKRWRENTPDPSAAVKPKDLDTDDEVMDLDDDGSVGLDDDEDGDFCPGETGGADVSVDADDHGHDSDDSDVVKITRPKRRRTLVVDSDEDEAGKADADLTVDVDEKTDGDEAEETMGAADGRGSSSRSPRSAEEILAAYDASSNVQGPRDERLQKKFELAVGRLDDNPWFMRTTGGAGGGGDAGAASRDDGSGDGNVQPLGGMASIKSGNVKYTPLEQQYVDIKKAHPDKLLLVECGYKFQFFGEDALIASKACRIYCGVKQNFSVASVPTVALARHVSRLVAAGHKVGIVRQKETAALKKASGKTGTFRRELCEVYTRGTFFADGVLGDMTGSGSSASYIAAFAELGGGDDEALRSGKVKISVVAVDTATGDVVFDTFVDDAMRSELDSRLMALEPVEVVVPKSEMSSATERSFAHYCHEANARLDRVSDNLFAESCLQKDGGGEKLADMYKLLEDSCASGGSSIGVGDVVGCATALYMYLRQFKLERAIRGAHQFRSFAARKEMRLGADVMRNFEIFHNSNDGRAHGSLLSLLDRTRTAFGARQMKHWVAHPLTDAVTIRNRLDAVESLRQLVDGAFVARGGVRGSRTPDARLVDLLESMSKSFPDLERGLARISYEKCSPSLFVGIVNAFGIVAESLQSLKETMEAASQNGDRFICFKSQLLTKMIDGVPDIAPTLERFVFKRLNLDAAGSNDYRRIFKEKQVSTDGAKSLAKPAEAELHRRVKELFSLCQKVKHCEDDLDCLLVELRRKFRRPTWEWKKVAQDEYLLEVPTNQAKSMPKDWEIVNTTKAQKRYRPRLAAELLQLLEEARERCDEAASDAWKAFLCLFSLTTVDLRAVVRFLSDLDCLASHARTSLLPNYVKPEILDPAQNKAGVHALDARHPIAEVLLDVPYVPNEVRLGITPQNESTRAERCMVITGPNMGGKSSYIRMTGLLAIMAQVGCYVPANSARVSPFDAIFCRMGARDMIGNGMSTLMCELAETSKILEIATDRSLIVLDELGRGTSTHDGTAIAAATLEHLITTSSSVVLFVTHFPSIARLADAYDVDVGSYFLDYLEEDGDAVATAGDIGSQAEKKKKITFLYKVTAGVAKRSYGLNVALLAGLPTGVIDQAAVAASLFDKNSAARSAESAFVDVMSSLATEGGEAAGRLASRIGCATGL